MSNSQMFPSVTEIAPVNERVVTVCELVPAEMVAELPLRIEVPASLMLNVSAVEPSEVCVINLQLLMVPVTGAT